MKFGISEKIVFLFVLLVIALETITGLYFIRLERDILLEEFDERADALVQSLALGVEYPVLMQDNRTLEAVGRGALKQKDVVYCRIENKQGKVLFEGGSGRQNDVRRYTLSVLTQRMTKSPGRPISGSAQENGEQIGVLHLWFSLVGLQRRLSEAKITVAIFVLTGTALASLFIAWLVRFVLHKPIKKLLAGTKRISGGDLQYKVIVRNKDEIGELADSFNSMTVALRKLLQEERKLAAQAAVAEIEHIRAAELERAYNQLEKVNRELNDFAYIVSHDLKAPLRGIKSLANWITTDYADKFDPEAREHMDLLVSRVDRMHNLIGGILQYCRVGRLSEEKVPVDVNEVVSEVIDTLAAPAHVEITIEDELPTIACEQTHITQIFQNLLSNAIKYMDKAEGRISISHVERDEYWQFTVADNGSGIEDRHFEKIFGMFQTLSPRDEFESTGVGLAVVKKIVELYGGRIWVQSQPGQGSTFFFTWPKQAEGAKK